VSQSPDQASITGVPDLAEQVREQFATLVRLISMVELRAWMSLDITMAQFKVMLFLWQERRARVGLLAENLGIHVTNVTGILDRLVEAGFVRREEDAGDRRIVVSRLTPKGEATLATLYEGRAARIHDRLTKLSPEQLHALRAGLEALLAEW
jgi:DNA-binding MarR family transcriptional regulator